VCDLKVLTKKQQVELAAAFQRKVGGGEPLSAGPSSAGLSSVAPAASNLSAFKLNVNNFTRELASTLNRANRPEGGPGGMQQQGQGQGQGQGGRQQQQQGQQGMNQFR
jgi:hypothetical protein